jgi:exonuclease III
MTNVINVIDLPANVNVVNDIDSQKHENILMTDKDQAIEVIISKRPTQSPLLVTDPAGSASVLQTLTDDYKWDLPVLYDTNVRSLCHKTDELEMSLQQLNVGIASITETWCTDDQPDAAMAISGYSMIRRDRGVKRGGGIMCYVRSSIPFKTWPQLGSDLETLWITARPPKLPRQFSTLVIGTIYHPPGANNSLMKYHITTCLDTILKSHPHSGIVLMGDLNTLPVSRILTGYNLKQIVSKPTRGSNILDKVLTNMHNLYQVPTVYSPLGTADHSVVVCDPLPAYRTPAPKAYMQHSPIVLVKTNGPVLLMA